MAKGESYEQFVEKFKPKKTTDDCITPPLIYETVKEWACAKYGIEPANIVRPFWPGGDYEHFDYPHGCVVLDNPPFSILSKICTFYLNRGIPFLLFAPALTAFSGRSVVMRMNHILCNADIVYENGACVKTAFVTSFGGDLVAQTAPELDQALKEAIGRLKAEKARSLPKYSYPPNVLTAAMLKRYSKYGIDFSVRRDECVHLSKLDSQEEQNKAVYGGGLLLSSKKAAERTAAERTAAERAAAERAAAERAAAERAAAERAAATIWHLSQREKEMIERLDAK